MENSESFHVKPLPTRPFLFLLLALILVSGFSLWFTAWCWPRYGEQACGRYVLPIDFLMSLVIFTLAALVFDQPWGKLFLYAIGISLAMVLGNLLARLIYTAPALPFQSLTDFWRYLQATLMRLLFYQALVQVFLPAAILRGLTRRDWERITLLNAAAFGVMIGVIFTLFIAGLFWLASIIQPGSVAPGYIFTWNNFLSSLTVGLAACLGVLLGKALRTI